MAKAKSTKRSTNKRQRVKRTSKKEQLDPFFTKRRIQRITGFTLVLTSIFLTVAFISYCVTWKADQDKVLEFSWNLLFSKDLEIANHLGSLGAFQSSKYELVKGAGVARV